MSQVQCCGAVLSDGLGDVDRDDCGGKAENLGLTP